MRKIKRETFENLEELPAIRSTSQAVSITEATSHFSKLELNALAESSLGNAAITLRLGKLFVAIQDGTSEATINHTLCAIGRLC